MADKIFTREEFLRFSVGLINPQVRCVHNEDGTITTINTENGKECIVGEGFLEERVVRREYPPPAT